MFSSQFQCPSHRLQRNFELGHQDIAAGNDGLELLQEMGMQQQVRPQVANDGVFT